MILQYSIAMFVHMCCNRVYCYIDVILYVEPMYDLLVNLVKGSIPYTYIQVAHYTGKRVSEWLAYIPSLTLHNAHELFMKEEEKKKT